MLSYYSIYRKQGEREIDIYRVHLHSGLPAPDVCSKPSDWVTANSCGALVLPVTLSALGSSSLVLKEDTELDNVGLTGLLAAQC